ncbi:hypothetical protein AUR64_12720 [Haloprofundus marisrubri]|uniref:DUF5658 domain-containing protein n=1 Tax=Haloprofundus marisrubri TaxID=1514971 RepID=A0A0W1RBE0_9EURY|nr:hypothetical protein [Haloprofundus marisrubri]KTG10421.1 hypothetical protein AUR64_12720 [Haloprofundus marisrubri]
MRLLPPASASALADRLSLTETPFDEREFTNLWFLATLGYGVGDTVTTIALMSYSPTVIEGNPVLRWAVAQFGQSGLVGLKLVAFFACLALSIDAAQDGDKLWYYAPPIVLTLAGAFTTVYNVRLMLG